MSATGESATGRGVLLQQVLELVSERVAGEPAEVVAEFARAYSRRLPADADLDAEQLYGHVIGLFELADRRGEKPIAVRVFNATPAVDGYRSGGTVVETNTDDIPFLVDSVRDALQARDLSIGLLLHPVIGTERAAAGRLVRVGNVRVMPRRESVMHFEVDRRLEADEAAELEAAVRRILADVRKAVGDFEAMKERVGRLIEAARAGGERYDEDEIAESAAFLEWLLEDNFLFLGYREYELVDAADGRALHVVPGSGLGILRDVSTSSYSEPVPLAAIEPKLRARIESGDLLVVSKTNRPSSVHRRARMDYIGVKRVGTGGAVVGELRILGLFTSRAYAEPAGRVPLLRRKLQQILAAEELVPGSHDYKAAISMVESFPLDELFAVSTAELGERVAGLLELQEQEKVRLFLRRDPWDRSISVLVAMPRDRFNAALRQRLQALLLERFGGSSVDYHLSLGETDPALVHFVIHLSEGSIRDVSFAELEREVIALTRTWDDRLRETLVGLHGDDRGRALARAWAPRFPDYYKSSSDATEAADDIAQFERLEQGEQFVVALRNEHSEPGSLTRILLYKRDGKVKLSEFMPILEALGLTVVEEVPTRLLGEGEMFLHDFGVLGPDGELLDLGDCGHLIAASVSAVWRGEAESDWLNRLVVLAGLDWRQVAVLRAYRKYRQRVTPVFTERYQNDAFAANPRVAAKLVRLFELRLRPAQVVEPGAEEALRAEIENDLDAVESLDHDRILRGFLGTIQATVRTNVFRGRPCTSFKLRSAAVPEMPRPLPLYEIFVYSPQLEGIHLRAGKVARGGIRWSDRMEDYRTEILGLMKAQTTKNAVIVPTGSKGGFVLLRPPRDPLELREEVRRQYATFVRSLLDLTDNLVGGAVVRPPDVRVLDDDDPYLVVAADKGTGTLSDTANAVAIEYGFWLGDAFASGGSAGYDHKKLAITARGVWESVKRHFRELGRDVESEPFTVVGIGDMSGDVFGNGMLLSEHIRLVASFDHRHVFLDPNPDPSTGITERRRLFDLPSSSWDDYRREAISPGGGVWPRTAKRIPLSPEARAALGIEAEKLTPNEVIQAILRAPVDLLWNGGIGTYVKATDETNADVGDRGNDAVRINGAELRAKVVAEGGNLGLTQRGRVEYSRAGGRVNTDFIDNSAGVDCSDHEVNLKILLGLAVAAGDLTMEERNGLLAEVADDVVAHVLYDNYLQAQILSQEVALAPDRPDAHEDLMAELEAEGLLDRGVESLPGSDEMAERARAGAGLTRPELCVLLAYAKLSLKGKLLGSTLPDDAHLERDLRRYFPPQVVQRFGPLLSQHPLRRELIATIMANAIVNSEGITFVSRTARETGARPDELARAYRIAREATDAAARWDAIEALDGKIDPMVQNELMTGVDWLVEKTSRWYLRNAPSADLGTTIEEGRAAFAELSEALPTVAPEAWRSRCRELAARLETEGVPAEVAVRHALQPDLVHAPDILAVAREVEAPVPEVARAFLLIGEALYVDWLESRLEELPVASRWDRWALNAVEEDLLNVRREAAERALASSNGEAPEAAVEEWLGGRSEPRARLDRLMRRLEEEGIDELSALTVAVRQIRGAVGSA